MKKIFNIIIVAGVLTNKSCYASAFGLQDMSIGGGQIGIDLIEQQNNLEKILEEAKIHHHKLLSELELCKNSLESAKEVARISEEKSTSSNDLDDEEEAITAQEEYLSIRKQRIEILKAIEQSKQHIDQLEQETVEFAAERAGMEESQKSSLASNTSSKYSKLQILENVYMKIASQIIQIESQHYTEINYSELDALKNNELQAFKSFIEEKFANIKGNTAAYISALEEEKKIYIEKQRTSDNLNEADTFSRAKRYIHAIKQDQEKELEKQRQEELFQQQAELKTQKKQEIMTAQQEFERFQQQQAEQEAQNKQRKENLKILSQEFEREIKKEFSATNKEDTRAYLEKLQERYKELKRQKHMTEIGSEDSERFSIYTEIFSNFMFDEINKTSKRTQPTASTIKSDVPETTKDLPAKEKASDANVPPTFPDVSSLDERSQELAKRLKAFGVGYSVSNSDINNKYHSLLDGRPDEEKSKTPVSRLVDIGGKYIVVKQTPIDDRPDDMKIKINGAFKKQSLKVHPDKQGGSTEAFQALDDARKAIIAEIENPGYWYKSGEGIEPENRFSMGSYSIDPLMDMIFTRK